MALCLAVSLTEKHGFNAVDQMHRYLDWAHNGYMNSRGPYPPTDIGGTTRRALAKYGAKSLSPYCGSTEPNRAGNGSIMRLAPIPLFFAKNARQAIEKAAESSLLTHATPSCVDGCRYMAGIIVGALQGKPKEVLLAKHYCPVPGLWESEKLDPEIDAIANGSFKVKEPPAIVGEGHVVKTLEAALWAFYKTANFEDGCIQAVNIGNDTDTVGAVYGQIAGAYYGEQGIPSRWLSKLHKRDLISGLAEKLYTAAQG